MSRPSRTRARAAAFALVPGLVLLTTLAGCGKTVRASDVESKIVKNLQGQMPSRTITVDCPSGKKAETGSAFRCTAKIDGAVADVDVRLETDSRFSFRIHTRK